ncbi:MAG: hypothetical protein H7270_05670 [Dermatophilaceae bacterium]|nr:hypothetical protein [Dermatophilaceae bacterium]
MTPHLVHGDHISCSRVGGAMRRESERLRRRARSLEDALDDLMAAQRTEGNAAMGTGTATGTVAAISTSLGAMRTTADDLDEAGAALQRYATDLAEGHELGRRAQRRVAAAGLLLEGTRVVEPWGPAGADEAEHRRAQVPEVQSRVDLATAQVGRARGRLEREAARLTEALSAHSRDARSAPRAPRPLCGGSPAN